MFLLQQIKKQSFIETLIGKSIFRVINTFSKNEAAKIALDNPAFFNMKKDLYLSDEFLSKFSGKITESQKTKQTLTRSAISLIQKLEKYENNKKIEKTTEDLNIFIDSLRSKKEKQQKERLEEIFSNVTLQVLKQLNCEYVQEEQKND